MVHICVETGEPADIDDLLPVLGSDISALVYISLGNCLNPTIFYHIGIQRVSVCSVFLEVFWVNCSELLFFQGPTQWGHSITVGQPKQGGSQNSGFRESKVPGSGLD